MAPVIVNITRAVRAKFRCGVGCACHIHTKGWQFFFSARFLKKKKILIFPDKGFCPRLKDRERETERKLEKLC